jgi:DNA-binding SARP family transcriptional activator
MACVRGVDRRQYRMNMGSANGLLAHTSMQVMTDQAALRLRLIGQMEAWSAGGESVLPTGRKTRALLAVVALSTSRQVLRARLAETLWSRRPEEQARASLRQEIHRLLEALAPLGVEILSVSRDHIALRPNVAWVDTTEVGRATAARPEALGLLDGELLEDLDGLDPAFDVWLASERERLRDRARTVAEHILREQSGPESTIPAAQQLLSIDRTHEGAWRALMRAHAQRGERGMAIEAYERCRTVLADMLDATPSEETQRLLAELRVGLPEPAADATAAPVAEVVAQASRFETRQPAGRSSPRLGVLPLQILGTDVADAHLATGMAEEVTTALTRVRWISVVSSASLARFAAETREEGAIRRAFGLDYLLDGTIQHAGDNWRVTFRLIDLRAGNQVVWAPRFDRQGNNVLKLQDEVAASVAAQIDPELLRLESQRMIAAMPDLRPAADTSAYNLMMRAVPLIYRLERAPFLQAGVLLRQAITRDPDYAPPHAWLANWNILSVTQGWAEDRAAAVQEGSEMSERAVMLDPQDAHSLTIAGHVRVRLSGQLQEGVALHARAVGVDPNFASAWALSGFAQIYLGNNDEAQRHFDRYKALSPLAPNSFYLDSGLVLLALMQRDHERAVSVAHQVGEMKPGFVSTMAPYLSALGHLGRDQEAEALRARLLTISPACTLSLMEANMTFARPEDTEHYLEGLRRAGLPA